MNSCSSTSGESGSNWARHAILSVALLAGFVVGCQSPRAHPPSDEVAVRKVLDQQIQEWNAGNLAGFMETYDRSAQTRFASGGAVQRGWQSVFDRYQSRYPNRATMGRTVFSEVEIETLGPDSAMAFGHWRLEREQGDQPQGVFTLILKRKGGQWRIVHDHTSVADKK